VKLNADRQVFWGRLVILVEPPANFSGLYSNYRVISGRVSRRALKEVDSNDAFLEPLVVPLQAVLYYVGKKLLAALAWLKKGTVQDRIQFTKDLGSFNIINGAGIAIDSFAPDLSCYRTHGPHRLLLESNCD